MKIRGGLVLESIAPQEWRVVHGDAVAYLRLDRLRADGRPRVVRHYAWSVVRDSRVTSTGLRWCLADALDDVAHVLLRGARRPCDVRREREAA